MPFNLTDETNNEKIKNDTTDKEIGVGSFIYIYYFFKKNLI